LDLNKILAIHLMDNLASGSVLKKCGMMKEGEFKEHIRKGIDILIFASMV